MSKAVADLHLDYLGGRWDRPKKSLRAQVQRSRRKGATITLHSEIASKNRSSALRHRDYRLLQKGVGTWRAESAMSVHTPTWQVEHWEAPQLAPDFGVRGPVSGVVAVLRHRATGRRLLVSTMHLPASVEMAWMLRTRRVRSHVAATASLRKVHRRLRRRFKPDAEVCIGDWNLNLFRDWVRRTISAAWPALKPLPKKALPKKGTHGNRLIDWPMLKRLFKVTFRVHPPHPASDHRGTTLKGRIRPRR